MRGIARSPRRLSVVLIALGVVTGGVFFVAPRARATTADGDVVLGAESNPFVCSPGTDANCENSATVISNALGGDALDALTNGQNASAIDGENFGTGAGVFGDGEQYGVKGQAATEGGIGVFGSSSNGDAIVGQLTQGNTGTNAVAGHANNGGNGVDAQSNSQYTIGQSGHFNAALFAENTSTGTALWARQLHNGGQGAYIEAWGAKSTALKVCGCSGATALSVSGPVSLSRSGVVTVAGTSTKPSNSVKVSVSPITSKSIMTATLQKYVSGVFVVAAVPNVSGGYFTVYLNKAVTTSVGPIAWEVVEHP